MARQSATTKDATSKDPGAAKTDGEPPPVFPNPNLLPLASYLESIINLLRQAYNSREHYHLRRVMDRYFAPTIQVYEPYSNAVRTTTREEYAQRMTSYLQMAPNFHSELYNTSTLVDERNQTAQVFTTNRVLGADNGNLDLTRESIIVYHFQGDGEGEWLCVRLDIIRGPGHWSFC